MGSAETGDTSAAAPDDPEEDPSPPPPPNPNLNAFPPNPNTLFFPNGSVPKPPDVLLRGDGVPAPAGGPEAGEWDIEKDMVAGECGMRSEVEERLVWVGEAKTAGAGAGAGVGGGPREAGRG